MIAVARPALLLLFAVYIAPMQVRGDEVEDFHRGRTMTVMVGAGTGGDLDLQMRRVARYIA